MSDIIANFAILIGLSCCILGAASYYNRKTDLAHLFAIVGYFCLMIVFGVGISQFLQAPRG